MRQNAVVDQGRKFRGLEAKNWYGGLETRDVPIRVKWGRMGMLDNR
jgi:hypothetical protein